MSQNVDFIVFFSSWNGRYELYEVRTFERERERESGREGNRKSERERERITL